MTATHGDKGTCAVCDGAIEFIQYTASTGPGAYEVLDQWWAHNVHPVDGHDAALAQPHIRSLDGDGEPLHYCAVCFQDWPCAEVES